MKLFFPDDPEARRRRDRVLVLLFALASVFLVLKASRKTGGVLLRNQEFGAQFLARADPYYNPRFEAPFHGPYPPSFALVAAPLALLPTPVARVAWSTLQVGALVLCFHLGRRRLRQDWPELAPHATVVFGAALLLVSRYVLRDMAGGGGNLLYGTLAFLGLELALAGRERVAGLPFGLGLVLKPNLAPLLLALLFLRRWRASLAAALVGVVLFWVPALYYGPAEYASEAARWARRVTAYAALDDLHASELVPEAMPPAENAMNQSLRESVHRL
ncbi:MAG: glycosyltransferase family 87 protein, partial [Planctomycetota bacterium]|nr:glycosyltransferase family 87 protein [Planctomycetota bacterium]